MLEQHLSPFAVKVGFNDFAVVSESRHCATTVAYFTELAGFTGRDIFRDPSKKVRHFGCASYFLYGLTADIAEMVFPQTVELPAGIYTTVWAYR
jgi:hypothetical protein